jgi:type IX secretion system PorP/SprF family membrane protein
MYQPLINFSSASSYDALSAAVYYRNQWVGFNGTPVNYTAQFAMPLAKINSSFGVRFVRDEIGVMLSDVISLNYAYKVKLNQKSFLSFSLSPRLGFLKENRSKLVTVDGRDPLTNQNIQRNGLLNAEFGTYYYRKNFYVGTALPNLLQNNLIGSNKVGTYFEFKSLGWFIHSGYEFSLRGKNNFNISALVKSDIGVSLLGEFNAMYQFNNKLIGIGASYRTTKDLVAMARFSFFRDFSFSYSYQYNLSNLKTYQVGSHELTVIYELKAKKNLVSINVPRF